MLGKIVERKNLSFEEAYQLFKDLTRENEVRIGAYLTALQTKGYGVEELAGFAKAMRDSAKSIDLGIVADTEGTGGDNSFTINVSTASSLILSNFHGVAKHGNSSITSRSGSADVLNAMGIDALMSTEKAMELFKRTNFTFLFAPRYHPFLKRIMPVRRMLGVKTIFNIIGPLCNPAKPKYQLIGVNSPNLVSLVAEALRYLDIKKALVIHGEGLDEANPNGRTIVGEVNGENVDYYTLYPEDLGIKRSRIIPCRNPEESAERILKVFRGEGKKEDRNFIVLNSSLALYASGFSDLMDAKDCVESVLGDTMMRKMEEILCFFKN